MGSEQCSEVRSGQQGLVTRQKNHPPACALMCPACPARDRCALARRILGVVNENDGAICDRCTYCGCVVAEHYGNLADPGCPDHIDGIPQERGTTPRQQLFGTTEAPRQTCCEYHRCDRRVVGEERHRGHSALPFHTATICAMMLRAISAGVRPPMSSPIGACTRATSAAVKPAERSRSMRSAWVLRLPNAPT